VWHLLCGEVDLSWRVLKLQRLHRVPVRRTAQRSQPTDGQWDSFTMCSDNEGSCIEWSLCVVRNACPRPSYYTKVTWTTDSQWDSLHTKKCVLVLNGLCVHNVCLRLSYCASVAWPIDSHGRQINIDTAHPTVTIRRCVHIQGLGHVSVICVDACFAAIGPT
jgi:hypothetical protein